MPPFTARLSTDSFGYSWIVDCSSSPVAMSGTAAFTGLTGGADRDPMLPHPTCKALKCSIGELLLNSSLFGPDWTSSVMGESCAVTYVEGYQAANESSGTLTCVYEEVAGGRACRSFVRSMIRQQRSATSAVTSCLRAVVGPLAERVVEQMAVFQQLPCTFRQVNLSAMHQLSIRRVRRCPVLTLRYRAVLGASSPDD